MKSQFANKLHIYMLTAGLLALGLIAGSGVIAQQSNYELENTRTIQEANYPPGLTGDQKYELDMYRKFGGTGLPPNFGKRFIKAQKNPIPDSWIVTFVYTITDANVQETARSLARTYGMKVRKNGIIRGDVVRMALMTGSEESAKRLSEDPKVRQVGQDARGERFFDPSEIPTPRKKPEPQTKIKPERPKNEDNYDDLTDEAADEAEAPGEMIDEDDARSENRAYDVALEPSQGGRYPVDYNLDRIDTRPRFYDQRFFTRGTGRGVDIYVMDGGVALHPEFGNACSGINCSRVVVYRNPFNDGYFDCDGHGTAVASAAAGRTYGVASEATIIALRIYNCSGQSVSDATFIQYLNDIRTRVIANRPRQAVVNISYTYGLAPSSLDGPLTNLIAAQVLVVVGAGQAEGPQYSTNHTQYWPQRVSGALRVGMTENFDRKYDYTTFPQGICVQLGPCLPPTYHFTGSDIFAPAGPKMSGQFGNTAIQKGIAVAQFDDPTVPAYLKGTSYAAPQVAGVAAIFLGQNSAYVVKEKIVKTAILDNATSGALSGLSGEPNKLLYEYFSMAAARNAASYTEAAAPDSLVTAFADFGAPPALVTMQSEFGATYVCPMSYSGSSQVNFRVPAGVPLDTYSVRYTNATGGLIGFGAIQINSIAPGLFSYDGDGNGVASGHLLKVVRATGAQTYVALSTSGNSWAPATEDAYLVLFGTGIRGHNGLSNVSLQVKRGSTIHVVPVLFAGAQGGSPGLDQVNAGPLPVALLGLATPSTHELKLYVNGPPGTGVLANIVEAKFN